MRKNPISVKFFLLITVLAWLLHNGGFCQNTLFVPGEYATIQEALNNAQETDTINIEAGEYAQSLFINNHAFLKGNGVTISGDTIMINSGKNLYFNGDFIVNSEILLENGNLGPATFFKNGNLVLNESIFIYDFLETGNFNFISVPVANEMSSSFFGCHLYYHDENLQQYIEINETNIPLVPGVGYIISCTAPNDTILLFSGEPNLDNINTDLICSGSLYDGYGWNYVGNPYAAYINWDLMEKPDGMGYAIYYYEPKSGKFLFNVNGIGNMPPFIPPMKGFFVHYIDIQNTPEITFSQDLCIIPDQQNYHQNNKESVLGLRVSGNGKSDETFIQFNELSTQGYDLNFDALKINPDPFESLVLYTKYHNDSVPYSVNALPQTDLVNLFFNTDISGNFTIEAFETSEFIGLFLEDIATGEITDLLTTSYSFDFKAGDYQNRFIVHFNNIAIDPIGDVIAYGYKDAVFISIPNDGNTYTGSIRKLYGNYVQDNIKLQIGLNRFVAIPGNYYFVKIITNFSSEQTFTVFTFESQPYKSDNLFVIFPNPYHERLSILNTSSPDINCELNIYDNKGDKVKTIKDVEFGLQGRFAGLKPGIYYFVFSKNDSLEPEIIKVVKE